MTLVAKVYGKGTWRLSGRCSTRMSNTQQRNTISFDISMISYYPHIPSTCVIIFVLRIAVTSSNALIEICIASLLKRVLGFYSRANAKSPSHFFVFSTFFSDLYFYEVFHHSFRFYCHYRFRFCPRHFGLVAASLSVPVFICHQPRISCCRVLRRLDIIAFTPRTNPI